MYTGLRLGVRAIIVCRQRLLLVNAFGYGKGPELWCAPGGGVRAHSSLKDNLVREVLEETGLIIKVGNVAMVNEFHDPDLPFHQIEVFFRASVSDLQLKKSWHDPDNVVHTKRFLSRNEIENLPVKPSMLTDVAFDPGVAAVYDPLELMVR